jgi:CheY-like chemotaxis protein
MKALMVMPSMLLSSVPDAFAKAGFKIHLAENATFALTMLERDQPDLIVSSDELGDMSGRDLHEIVRSDPAMNSVTSAKNHRFSQGLRTFLDDLGQRNCESCQRFAGLNRRVSNGCLTYRSSRYH